MITLRIGGIPISVESSDSISQTYAAIGGFADVRTLAGGLIRQRNWRKLKSTISVGEARFLPAVQGLDLDVPQLISCVGPRSIASASPAIALPSDRRADVVPYGFAVLPGGFMQPTTGVLAGDTLTLTAVATAVQYQACYVPEFMALITDLNERFDYRSAVAGWDITVEQV